VSRPIGLAGVDQSHRRHRGERVANGVDPVRDVDRRDRGGHPVLAAAGESLDGGFGAERLLMGLDLVAAEFGVHRRSFGQSGWFDGPILALPARLAIRRSTNLCAGRTFNSITVRALRL
jgi:hypothetical protein